MGMILCKECCLSINGKSGIQSILISGPCQVCKDPSGRETIALEEFKTFDKERALQTSNQMKGSHRFFLLSKMDSELFQLPPEKLKPGVLKVMHLVLGEKNVKCLAAITFGRKVLYSYHLHGKSFCPHVLPIRKKLIRKSNNFHLTSSQNGSNIQERR